MSNERQKVLRVRAEQPRFKDGPAMHEARCPAAMCPHMTDQLG